jgi:Domain of unknown function (DUF4402)
MTSRIFASLAVLAGLLVAPLTATAAQNSATQSISVAANVVGGISVASTVDLDFASLLSGTTAGSVTVSSSGTRSTTGGASTVGGGFTPASFQVSITQGNPHYSIQLPVGSVTLSGTGGSMLVDTFESTPGGPGFVGFAPGGGSQVMTVGATLHVPANQAAGSYSGTFTVTVIQQ